jgi:hypothetical protein
VEHIERSKEFDAAAATVLVSVIVAIPLPQLKLVKHCRQILQSSGQVEVSQFISSLVILS